jgi:thiaminase/transcriptional activator TenA
MGSICERLRDAAQPSWEELHRHPFVTEMARGILPARKFAFYIGQNLRFLPDLARMLALGVAKAEDEQTMREFAASMTSILEFEIPKNRELLEKVRQLEPAAAEAAVLSPANFAYTRHLLTVGYSGRPPDIAAALMPCAWSYGEIGREYVARLPDHPVYHDWIEFFAGRKYWQTLDASQRQLERLCSGLSEGDLHRIAETFTTSTRLERAFWDMAYNEAQWAS